METIEGRYRHILNRVQDVAQAAGRTDVTLLAVSKTHPAAAIEALYRNGHRDFGENYAQELAEKAEELEARDCTGIRWHFIGHLQTNKVKQIIPWVHAVHSVDSEKLAAELAKRWATSGRTGKLPVFIEVNVENEPTKAGILSAETPALARQISAMPELSLLGLMCIPSSLGGTTGAAFEKLRLLEVHCRPATLGKLSMGMTQDFEQAIRHGATHLRVGTAIFGEREKKA